MSKRVVSFAAGVAVAVVLGCAPANDAMELGQLSQAVDRIPNSGFVPYPIRIDPVTLEPSLNPDGSYQPAWDGSLADLMAADAYALCAATSDYAQHYPAPSTLHDPGNDAYLQHLDSRMDVVGECGGFTNSGSVFVWRMRRKAEECNIDPRSNKPAVIEDFEREEPTPYESFYDFNEDWDVTAPSSSIALDARMIAGLELEYADINLCMAQRLREQLNGGQSLFTSTEDHAEILAVIRERAQLAVLWYSMLVKLFASPDPGPTSIDSAEHEFLVLIRRWFASTDNATKERIAEDFGTAIRLHLQTVHELAALYQRQAATRPLGEAGLDRAERDWGVGQPRHRLLNLLYGGDPIGGLPGSPPPPGRGFLHAAAVSEMPGYVKVDMSDPRVRTLVGLAREADALLIKEDVIPFAGFSQGFHEIPSGERMYRQIEVRLRSQACERDTPGDPTCLPSTIEAELPELGEFQEYLLWQEHRIEPRHALTLATAFDQAFSKFFFPFGPQTGKLHLFGAHSRQLIDGSYWIHIDKDFTTGALTGHELMEAFNWLDYPPPGSYVPRTMDSELDARMQGFVLSGGSGWSALREMGAVPALILAREAVLEIPSNASLAPFLGAATTLFSDLERAIGPRQAVLRNKWNVSLGNCPSEPSVQCKIAVPSNEVELEVLTRTEDPLDRLTRAQQSTQLDTIAADPGTVGFDGKNRAWLDATPTNTFTTQSYTSFAAGHQRRSTSYVNNAAFKRLFLRGDDPTSPGEQDYVPLFLTDLGVGMQFHSFGGNLHHMAEQAMNVLPHDWSRPAFDAFGLPVDWVPPADASLVGGAPGEPSYQYYLRKAKDAAREATAAVQVAIDSLIEETLLTEQLEAAETRAATISELETRALCGPNASCDVRIRSWRPSVRECSPDASGWPVTGDALAWCNQARGQLLKQLPSFPVASAVRNASGAAATFEEFEGSETQRILIRQWNAKRSLERAIRNAIDLAIATGREMVANSAAITAAAAELVAASAAIDAEIAQLASNSEIDALIAEMENAKAEIDTKINHTETVRDRECADSAYTEAYRAGQSFSDKPKGTITRLEDGLDFDWSVKYHGSRTWSPGPLYALADRCQAMNDDATIGHALAKPTKAVLQQKIEALIERRDELTPQQRDALTNRKKAAEQAYHAATTAAYASRQSAWAQMSAQYTHVQQAVGELLAATAELSQVQVRIENAITAANLEQQLAASQVEARFGIQRKFRSYDMWRARALLGSARRLSVAARRAIESRFVVDLSELEAPQAFVASPAIWADEVYRDDLNTPSVVGLTLAPTGGDGVAPNQLIDYVENLERFVQGYTVTYPTSVALPDSEVLVISGPAVTEVIEGNGPITEVLSGEALGWSFYCSEAGGWFPHPVIGATPVVGESADCGPEPVSGGACIMEGLCAGHPSCDCSGGIIVCGATLASRLAELCSGRPPTRARYNFALDPWGRVNGALRSMPLEQRHNVRWGRLAVNLVGTGIRDCQRAANPATCFSEPFVRFQLQHSGPAWMTNHAQQWRAFDLPTAFIEGGKALASEEWLDPIANGYTSPFVATVARGELLGRPIHGGYELILELGPELRPERIERVQLLVESEYWVRQQ